MFISENLTIARQRRSLTKAALAKEAGISTRTLSTYENAGAPETEENETVQKLASVLRYPIAFFFDASFEMVDQNSVSFRSMSKLSATKKNAALSLGSIGIKFSRWLDKNFQLPKADLIEFSSDQYADPETAAEEIRDYWNLGQLSIGNMVRLLESKGVRVFSLSENSKEVDAFSFWLDERPFVFLNTMKSFERSRFDAAHELGHLLLHKHSSNSCRSAEEQADRFASCLLMPRSSVLAAVPKQPSLQQLILLKSKWKVSLASLVRKTFDLQLSSEWHYRQLNIKLSRLGWRSSEITGINERETSLVIDKVCKHFISKGVRRQDLLKEIGIPVDELSALSFDHHYFNTTVISTTKVDSTKVVGINSKQPNLRIVCS